MLNLFYLFSQWISNPLTIFDSFYWAIVTLILFLVYSKYFPEPSTKKSIIYAPVISLVFVAMGYTPLWSYFPGNPTTNFILGNLFLAIIIGFVLSLVIHTTNNYKISIKIGTLTGVILFLIFLFSLIAVP